MFPGINWRYETTVDVYLDVIHDLTCHPHYVTVTAPPNGRVRGRSVPTHRLNMDLASNLTLEPESVMEPARSGFNQSVDNLDDGLVIIL